MFIFRISLHPKKLQSGLVTKDVLNVHVLPARSRAIHVIITVSFGGKSHVG
jgi:hypothetical protein